MGETGFDGLTGVVLIDERFDLSAEGEFRRGRRRPFSSLDTGILLVDVVEIARPGFGEVVKETELDEPIYVRAGRDLAQGVPDVGRPKDVLRDGFRPGAPELEPRPGVRLSIPASKRKLAKFSIMLEDNSTPKKSRSQPNRSDRSHKRNQSADWLCKSRAFVTKPSSFSLTQPPQRGIHLGREKVPPSLRLWRLGSTMLS